MKLSIFSKQALLEYAMIALLSVAFAIGAALCFQNFNDRAFASGIKRTQKNVQMHYEKAQNFHGLDRAYAETFTKVSVLSDLSLSAYTLKSTDDSFAMVVHLREGSCERIGTGVFGEFTSVRINGVEVLDPQKIPKMCDQDLNLLELISQKTPSVV